MVLLHSRYVSGNEFTAGAITAGSVIGLSGLNNITDTLNSLVLTGSTALIGSTWVLSGAATLIGSANESRAVMLIYNNSGSDMWLGPSSVTNLNGFKVSSNDTYEYLDSEVLYGTTLEAGSGDLRYFDILI